MTDTERALVDEIDKRKRLEKRLEKCETALTKTVSILTTYTNDGHNPPLEAARLVVEAARAAVEEKWAT